MTKPSPQPTFLPEDPLQQSNNNTLLSVLLLLPAWPSKKDGNRIFEVSKIIFDFTLNKPKRQANTSLGPVA